MPEIHTVRVTSRELDARGEGVLHDVHRTLGIHELTAVKTARVYRLQEVTKEQAEQLAHSALTDPITQIATIDTPIITDAAQVVEVAYQPGVMNPEQASLLKAAHALGIHPQAVDSSTEYAFYGPLRQDDAQKVVRRLLVNPTVERVIDQPPTDLRITGEVGEITIIPISQASDAELMKISKDKLFLRLDQMKVIQKYFKTLGREPTDAEVETIAARWSEHCWHETFKAAVEKGNELKKSLMSRIKETAQRQPIYQTEVVTAYIDNGGGMRFFEGQTIVGKTETHNSPSALDPYGGAMTGSGGVFRDIMGVGQGAKVISSTDIFCVAEPDLDPSQFAGGTLSPDYLLRHVVRGVADYGNRMGIPTANGSVHFDNRFQAKPTVLVGAYGILPESRAQKGEARKGDLVVAIGGRTGRDGIHGATFSSGEMTKDTISVNASAVQIGNAIEEKRMADALLEARDQGLIRAITDCGAAGFSSAIGEMAEHIGVRVDISKAPLKYSGLAPWEIWLSESQERMVAAISPKNWKKFQEICKKYNVEATALGMFDASHRLQVNFGTQKVVDLDYGFLTKGLPQRVMKADWHQPELTHEKTAPPTDWTQTLKTILSHGDVCSKEPIVRRYDHSVQGTNVMPPFNGVHQDSPNDATILTPILGKPYGMIISHGINPRLNEIDPYWGSVAAFTEALTNYVAVGGDPQHVVLANNYITGKPEDPQVMGALDKMVDGVCDAMDATGIPVITGKDSLSSSYRTPDGKLQHVPPVLAISAFGKIPDVRQTVSSDIKHSGSKLYLVGSMDDTLGGSVYLHSQGLTGKRVPHVNLQKLPKTLSGLHQAIQTGQILSCHDVSEGGVATTIAEMCFGGDCGAQIDIKTMQPDKILFNETPGMFVVEVEDEKTAEELFHDIPHTLLGSTQQEKLLSVSTDKRSLFDASIDELKSAWKEPMRRLFS